MSLVFENLATELLERGRLSLSQWQEAQAIQHARVPLEKFSSFRLLAY